MRLRIFSSARGIIGVCLITLLSATIALCLLSSISLDLLIPHPRWKQLWAKLELRLASAWADGCNTVLDWVSPASWEVRGLEGLSLENWYLVIANHQSWIDILALHRIFQRRIPWLMFFMKSQLKYMPFIGWTCWAMGYPFMKRYSSEFLKKHPEMKGKDLETTRQACQRYKNHPTTVVNFIEGTRFSKSKHRKQQSPYQHLLKPRAGGIAYTLGAMQDSLQEILNVTICYPLGDPTFFHFLSGDCPQVVIEVERIPITEALKGDYQNDAEFRAAFQQWLNTLWQRKDELMTTIEHNTQPGE